MAVRARRSGLAQPQETGERPPQEHGICPATGSGSVSKSIGLFTPFGTRSEPWSLDTRGDPRSSTLGSRGIFCLFCFLIKMTAADIRCRAGLTCNKCARPSHLARLRSRAAENTKQREKCSPLPYGWMRLRLTSKCNPLCGRSVLVAV